jgi:serine protease inhibitor
MQQIVRRIVFAIGVVSLSACASVADSDGGTQPLLTALPRALSADEQIAATATTEFGLALLRRVNSGALRDSNLALSPVSASVALGMLMNGAEQETQAEIRRTLGFGTRDISQINAAYRALLPLLTTLDPSVTMRFANAAWFGEKTPPSAVFQRTLVDAFNANVQAVRFEDQATVNIINNWASGATNGRIPSIFDRFVGDELAVLANATYFKGKWRSQFSADATRPGQFRTGTSTSISVPMMNTPSGLYRAGQTPDGGLIAELPFGGDAFVMTIVRPPIGTLNTVIDSLTPARWNALLARLPVESTTDQLTLPKFRLETSRELGGDLSALGMPRAFRRDAQLNAMFATPVIDAAVTSVKQKVFVDINEEGGEAAAVTAVTIRPVSTSFGLIINQPFLFAIRERLTGTVLFFGKVLRPVAP